jgi:hypothetical protein
MMISKKQRIGVGLYTLSSSILCLLLQSRAVWLASAFVNVPLIAVHDHDISFFLFFSSMYTRIDMSYMHTNM